MPVATTTPRPCPACTVVLMKRAPKWASAFSSDKPYDEVDDDMEPLLLTVLLFSGKAVFEASPALSSSLVTGGWLSWSWLRRASRREAGMLPQSGDLSTGTDSPAIQTSTCMRVHSFVHESMHELFMRKNSLRKMVSMGARNFAY